MKSLYNGETVPSPRYHRLSNKNSIARYVTTLQIVCQWSPIESPPSKKKKHYNLLPALGYFLELDGKNFLLVLLLT